MSKQKLSQKTIFIEGMHCSACEILLEKELLKIDGVEYADASLKSHSALIYLQPGTKINFKKINSKLRKLNYKVLKEPHKKNKMPDLFKSLTVTVLLLVVFLLFEKLQLGKYVNFDSNLSFFSSFLLGLVASVSSCAALIGGVLLSLSKHWQKNAAKSHFLFHLSRIASFFVMGGILGAVGSVLKFEGLLLSSLLVIVVSLLMILIAMQMLEFGFAQKIRLAMPKSFSSKIAEKSEKSSSSYIVGALTFFLPCGFTLIAQGAALTSGSFSSGAGIMLAFAYGTLPALLVISFTSVKFGSKPHLNLAFNQVVGFILIFFALYNINSQFNVLGLPSLSDLQTENKISRDLEFHNNYESSEDEQIIELVAKDFDYFLVGESEFKAGIPTKLIVDNQGAFGCALALSVFGLTNDYTLLEDGENVIDLGKPDEGKYKITCSMGMVTPVTVSFNS